MHTTDAQLQEIVTKLQPLAEDFSGQVEEFRQEIRGFQEAVQKKTEAGRVLSISIVGRVKSGKSTFLNALLFGGESILAQAATPMTAALTFIHYAPKCRADVSFFSKEEWQGFLSQAATYDELFSQAQAELQEEAQQEANTARRRGGLFTHREITQSMIRERMKRLVNNDEIFESYCAAKEQVTLAVASPVSPDSCLGTVKTVAENLDDMQELTGILQDYVGAGGKYTAFVCSTTIYCNDRRLEGYEIVDTPGTNDPVISRGKKTANSLKKTNVVLAISPAGRFIDTADLVLLSQNLPLSGIQDFILIASQYDLAVRGCENKIPKTSADGKALTPLQRLIWGMTNVRRQLAANFKERISNIAEAARKNNGKDLDKWERILQARLLCVSAKAYILAKHWNNLTVNENEDLEIFNDMIPGYAFDRETMLEFSFLSEKLEDSPVRQEFERIKAEKARILASDLQNLQEAQKAKFEKLCVELEEKIKNAISVLESKDVPELEKNLKEQTCLLEKGRGSIEEAFENAIETAQLKFSEIQNQIRETRQQYSRLEVHTESHREEYERTVDMGHGFLCWRDWTGNRYKTVTRYRTITTTYAQTYDAVDQVEQFADVSRSQLENAIRDAVDGRQLKNQLSNAVLELFRDYPLDELEILKQQVNSAIRRIVIPDADFGDKDYAEMITSKFSGGRVENGQVDALRNAQSEALKAVISDLAALANEKMRQIEQSLRESMDNFVNTLIADLVESTRQLQLQLSHKAESLEKLKNEQSIASEISALLLRGTLKQQGH